jgi:hypothetical protein
MRLLIACALLVGMGCESPDVLCGSCTAPVETVWEDELWRTFDHRVEVITADDALGLPPGSATSATRVRFSEAENFLFILDLDGEPAVERATFRVHRRYIVAPEDPNEDADPRTAIRVDWSEELLGAFAQELGLGEIGSLGYFGGDGQPALTQQRDPVTDELHAIVVTASYSADAGDLLVRHRFDRLDY